MGCWASHLAMSSPFSLGFDQLAIVICDGFVALKRGAAVSGLERA
jgi:hypothetical protein